MASAVGRAVVTTLATGQWQARSQRLGAYLGERLRALIGHGVTEVRSVGLWAGVDVDPAIGTGKQICLAMAERGVLTKDTHGSTIRFAPPLVVEPRELDWAVDQLAAVLTRRAATR